MNINKPVTIITGTRKGIGRYMVDHYLEQGHEVAGCSRGEFGEDLVGYTHFLVDVSDEKSVKSMMSSVRQKFGRVDNLINNAGIASMNHTLLTPLSTVESIFSTNVFGTFLFCREAAKLMQRQHYGRIVNFSTVATPLKLEGEAAYAASKAAVLSLTEVMARELAEFGITVNALGPTPVMTDLIRSVPKEKMESLLARQAINRYGTFEDIVNIVDFYIRKESDFVTGQNIFLGGV